MASAMHTRPLPLAQRHSAPRVQPRAWRAGFSRLAVRAQAVESPAAPQAAEKPFMDELRAYAMKLHTRDQAPKEGGQPAAKTPFQAWVPRRAGFLAFIAESKVVYDEFERILREAAVPYYKRFDANGLERGAALQKDIAYMERRWGLKAPTPSEDGPGHTYARHIRELAKTNPPAFICHYYNHYFAHTAGGRMIGAKVSQVALDNWMGDFYKWEGDVKELLNAARANIEAVAAGWSREEKDACIEETPQTFRWAGSLVGLITTGPADAPADGSFGGWWRRTMRMD